MAKLGPNNIFREIFIEGYPGRLVLMMGYLPTISDVLFSEMDKTFNGEPTSVPAFYWIRQCHCFLSRYKEALSLSKQEVSKERKSIIQELELDTINRYEQRISNFKLRLIEYCKKGEALWELIAVEGVEGGDLEKFILCTRNQELYKEERLEIENDQLKHPYLFFDNDTEAEGIDNSILEFRTIWKKYYRPISKDYVPLYNRLLP